MDKVGLGKNSPFGWLVLASFFAGLLGGGTKLLQASSLASKVGGGCLVALGAAIALTLWRGGQFSQNNSSDDD